MSATGAAALAAAIRDAHCVLFITGAGLSADSGLPTYRGVGGLYEDQITEEGFAIEDALSIGMLRSRPEVCWRYLRQVGEACVDAGPNAGHRALAALEELHPNCWVLTQNIDGFHARAGSSNLIEMHGRSGPLYCMDCGLDAVVDAIGDQLPPRCSGCHGVLRPRVVLFGEMLPDAAVARYEAVLSQGPEVVVSVGTSSVFPYISGPVLEAAARGATTVEINPARTEISAAVGWHWQQGAADSLAELLREFRALG